MKSGTWLVAGLMISLSANVYLLVSRSSGALEDKARAAESDARRLDRARKVDRPAVVVRVPRMNADTADDDDPSSGESEDEPRAKRREAELEAELKKVQLELEQRLPPNERFTRHPQRSPELEAEIQPTLDEIFATPPGGARVYAVECHDRICKLQVDAAQDTNTWMRVLQEHRGSRFSGMTFGVEGTYLEVSTPDYLAGARYEEAVFAVIRSSPVVADCKTRFAEPGRILLRTALGSQRDVHIVMTGSLADRALGHCIRPVVDEAPAKVPLPAAVHSLPVGVLVVAPPEASPQPVPQPRSSEPAAPVEARAARR